MADIKPFKISVPQEKLDRLHRKLELAEFPDELEEAGRAYGTPLDNVRRVTKYWQDEFDWRRAEAELNKMPQFTTNISVRGFEELKIHFVHQKSDVKNAIPLLFSHGWPGSVWEVHKILPELLKGSDSYPAFHVVAPSLPGFGFSEGTKKKGFGLRQMAETFQILMQRLGYDEYVTQGGDWGSAVTRTLGALYPKHVKGSHINLAIPEAPSIYENPELYVEDQQTPLTKSDEAGNKRTKWMVTEGAAYDKLQRTRPQSLGYGLADSPVGLLGWVYEKLLDWTDDYPWTEDEICTWISIYWFSTAGPAASLRIYYETQHDPENWGKIYGGYVPEVKLGIARFPKELYLFRKLWNKTMGPLVFESEHDKGGHFAAFEQPDAIVKDLRTMFGKNGGAYGVVKGKLGYD